MFTTGVPFPFTLECAVWCRDHLSAERDAHEELYKHRIVANREFFQHESLDYITARILSIATAYNSRGVFYDVVDSDAVIDEGDLLRYADTCGVEWMSVTNVIDEISPEQWKAAAAKYVEKCEARSARRLAQ